MTPSDVLSRVRDQLAETTAAFWTNAELYRYETEAEREINLLVGWNIISTAATTVTTTSGYTLPTDCLSVTRVTFDGVPLRKLDRHMRDMDALDMPGYGGSITSGDPVAWFQIKNMAYLWPIPGRAATVRYYYLGEPAEVVSGSSAFTIPANYHNAIPDYVLYKAYVKDQDQGKAEWYKREWEEGKADALRREQNRKWAGGFPTVKDMDSNYSTYGGLV